MEVRLPIWRVAANILSKQSQTADKGWSSSLGVDTLILWYNVSNEKGTRACMGRREAYTGIWCGNLRERDHLGDPGVDGRIVLRWILRKWDVGVWTGSSWLRIGTGGRHL